MPSALTLHVVTPVTGVSPPHAPALAAALGPGVSVTCSRIEHGPASIECELDEALGRAGHDRRGESGRRGGRRCDRDQLPWEIPASLRRAN